MRCRVAACAGKPAAGGGKPGAATTTTTPHRARRPAPGTGRGMVGRQEDEGEQKKLQRVGGVGGRGQGWRGRAPGTG